MKQGRVGTGQCTLASPPTRGAWIETVLRSFATCPEASSPPTRGAWIETSASLHTIMIVRVAPHTGGVD